MPTAATTGAPSSSASASTNPTALVPFTRAAAEHVEGFLDVSQQITASTQPIQPVDIPAYGFMRGIYLEVTATGGSGTAVFKADAPFSAVQDIAISDVNGAPIVGPLDGYSVYLINKYGGYRKLREPKLHPDYATSTTGGTFTFLLYIPIEVNLRDALGSLGNMNAASSYKLRASIAPSTSIYSTNPATMPTVRVRAWLDAWTQPTGTDLNGNPTATQPPAHGTTSYWSSTTFNFSASGLQSPLLPRVGNYIRDLIMVWRDTSGVRQSTTFPAPLSVNWDTRLLKELQPIVWRGDMASVFGYSAANDAAGGLDTGVFVYDFFHEFDGHAGAELRDGWLPTIQSTRINLSGNFGSAGTLQVITNDVSPAGEVFV
jgi:hypothetical protein